jgi:hypothetical protein
MSKKFIINLDNITSDEVRLTKNPDDTYDLKIVNLEIVDENGELIKETFEGKIIFNPQNKMEFIK